MYKGKCQLYFQETLAPLFWWIIWRWINSLHHTKLLHVNDCNFQMTPECAKHGYHKWRNDIINICFNNTHYILHENIRKLPSLNVDGAVFFIQCKFICHRCRIKSEIDVSCNGLQSCHENTNIMKSAGHVIWNMGPAD